MITVNGAITLRPVDSRVLDITVDDEGTRETLTIRGRASRDASGARLTLAQAREQARLMRELGRNPILSAMVHIESDELAIDSGLYRITNVSTGYGPATGTHGLLDVSFTAERLGGAGHGGALTRRVVPSAELRTNSWGITSQPWVALPIGATDAGPAVAGAAITTNADGGPQNLFLTAGPVAYFLNGADNNRGECKVWDTGGSTVEAGWTRVLDRDHTFASPAHCVIDNGLVRFQPNQDGTLPGRHAVKVANAGWRDVTDGSLLDSVIIGSTAPAAWNGLRIEDLSSEIVVVRWFVALSSTPWLGEKAITLWRGKFLALVELEAHDDSSQYLGIGLPGATVGRFTLQRRQNLGSSPPFGRDNVRDESATSETGATTFTVAGGSTDDNFLVTVAAGAIAALGLLAARTTGVAFKKTGNGGAYLDITAARLSVYAGGVPYTATAHQDGHTATLTAGTSQSTAQAGYTGAGHARVGTTAGTTAQFDAVTFPTGGNRAGVAFRVAVTSVAAADILALEIVNTAGTLAYATVNIQANTAAHFAAANTWTWFYVELAGWDGSTTVRARVRRVAAPSAANFDVDEALGIVVGGRPSFPRDSATSALTETRVRHEVLPW